MNLRARLNLSRSEQEKLNDETHKRTALWEDESGQDLTEYALLMVLIALVAIASMKTLGTTVSNVFFERGREPDDGQQE